MLPPPGCHPRQESLDGQLDDVGLRAHGQRPEFCQRVGLLLLGGEPVGELGDDAPRKGDVPAAGPCGKPQAQAALPVDWDVLDAEGGFLPQKERKI